MLWNITGETEIINFQNGNKQKQWNKLLYQSQSISSDDKRKLIMYLLRMQEIAKQEEKHLLYVKPCQIKQLFNGILEL